MNKYYLKYSSMIGKGSGLVIIIVKQSLSPDGDLVNLLSIRVVIYLKKKGNVNNEQRQNS